MIVFETDFSQDPVDQLLDTFVGADEAFVPLLEKFLFQLSGNFAPDIRVITDPAGNVARLSGGRRVHVTMTTLDENSIREGWSRVRIRFPEDLEKALTFTQSSWMWMWSELKIRPGSSDPSFRILFRFLVDDADKKFGWLAKATTTARDPSRDEVYWEDVNWDIGLPLGEWFDITTYYRAGDQSNGRLKVAMQRDGQPEQIIHDIHDWTDTPHGSAIRGVRQWYPFQIYAAGADAPFLQHLEDQGFHLHFDVDRWAFSVDEIPDSTPDEDMTMQLETYWDDATNEWVLTWDGVEARRGPDHSDLLDAEKAQIEADNAKALEQLRQLDEAITAL